MSKKIILFLFLNTGLTDAAEPAKKRQNVDKLADLGPAIKQVRTQIIKRPMNPDMSSHRAGPRIDGDPEQRKKNIQEKK